MSTRRHAQRRGRRHIATHSKLTGSVWGPTLLVVSLCAAFVTTVFTASNAVAPTRAHDDSLDTVLAFLVPDECETMLLTELVIASTGVATGTSANELILGSADASTLSTVGAETTALLVGPTMMRFEAGLAQTQSTDRRAKTRSTARMAGTRSMAESDDDWIDAGNGLDTVYGGRRR